MKKFVRFRGGYRLLHRFKKGLFCCFSLLSFALSGQTDSIYTEIAIPEATIREQRFSRTGYSVWESDSLPSEAVLSLTNRLFWENGLNLRQNAPGTLATLSARGAGPNRTAVIWNGLNLQSPMNGVVDASLIPLWQGDNISVVQGGNSAALSSGAMGGSVLIETPFLLDRTGLSGNVGVEGGSFGRRAGQGSTAYVGEKISSCIRANWQTAENDFPFQKIGLNGQPFTSRQQNNFAKKIDVQQFNNLIINAKNSLKSAAWYQHSFRQIPPAITEAASNTWQRDWSGRGVATWDFTPNKQSKLQTRVAWQDEYIAFHFAGETEESRAQTALCGMEWQGTASRGWAWRLGSTAQYTRAASDGYKDKGNWYRQNRLAGYAQAERTFNSGAKVSALLRQEWVEGQAASSTWTLGGDIPLGTLGAVRGHVSRNFNLPTFNDRFWETLDNSALKPEKGYSADLGWVFRRRQFSAELTGFQLILDDWILWQPSPMDGIFRPGNLRKVSSRGLEAVGSAVFEYWGIQWKTKGRLQWSQTENEAVYGGSEAVLGKQLPYSPKISAGGGVWAERGGFSGAYLHQFTGKRFTTSDNNNGLPNFQTGTMLLHYVFKNDFWRWSRSLAFDFTIENIWGVAYQSIANRPMPGRNWRAGFVVGW